MKIEEIRTRYDRARRNAVQSVDDLRRACEGTLCMRDGQVVPNPELVYRDIEIATLWKVVMATDGKLAIRQDVFDEMLGTTNR